MTDYPDLQLYIGGAWRKTRADMPVVNPATEQEIGRLPRAGIADLDDALGAAEKASGCGAGPRPANARPCCEAQHGSCASASTPLRTPSRWSMASRSRRLAWK